MTIFRLKQLASTSVHAAGAMLWNYDRAELIADGVVHGIGVFCGLVAAIVLIGNLGSVLFVPLGLMLALQKL